MSLAPLNISPSPFRSSSYSLSCSFRKDVSVAMEVNFISSFVSQNTGWRYLNRTGGKPLPLFMYLIIFDHSCFKALYLFLNLSIDVSKVVRGIGLPSFVKFFSMFINLNKWSFNSSSKIFLIWSINSLFYDFLRANFSRDAA